MKTILTEQTQQTIINTIASYLIKNYIFPETAQKMATHIKAQYQNGVYKSALESYAFAQALTTDLQSISQDLHLQIWFDEAKAASIAARNDNKHLRKERSKKEAFVYANFGFEKVERLLGNIGYLDLRAFLGAEQAANTCQAAMNFLANCQAIIFDLRRNGGGSPTLIQLLSSYLFDGEPRHLNTFYQRPTDSYQQFWTLPHVSGQRIPNTPVYVLSSPYTFSAAEEFTYNLQVMKRATIIGEKTGGGAHPVELFSTSEGYCISLPTRRAINPITNTNWEGRGVTPDIIVPQALALKTAHLYALQQLKNNATDEEIESAIWDLEIAQAIYAPIQVDEHTLKKYVGLYAKRNFRVFNGVLQQTFRGLTDSLIPLSSTRFALGDQTIFEFVCNDMGAVEHLLVVGRGGQKTRITC